MSSIVFETPKYAGSFSYAGGSEFSYAVRFIQAVDLNGDGLDEVVFAGFETQFNTPANYTNTNVSIFGWSNGRFQNLTSQYLPNGANNVEAVGDITFGDFNRDGLPDIYLSGYADMNYQIHAYALMNQGGYFIKQDLGLTEWEHASAAGDINGDGYTDVVVTGYLHPSVFYLGGPSGLSKHSIADSNLFNSYESHGSGIAIGDFLGNGGVSIIINDAATANSSNDTHLISVVSDNNGTPLGFRYVSTLPTPRLNLLNDPNVVSHDVRARAMDFNHDGLTDVLVFSYVYGGVAVMSDGTHHQSEIQFLRNDGQGVFTDVTEQYRVGYDASGYVSYNPQIGDFNSDGKLDIFSSSQDWFTSPNSTTLLLAQDNGTYVDTARTYFSSLLPKNGGQMSLIHGPNSQLYVLIESQTYGGSATVSLSKISFHQDGSGATILPGAAATYSVPVGSVQSIGLSPDGFNLIIKVGGVTSIIARGDSLEFADSTLTTEELTAHITPIPVFKSSGGTGGYALPDLYTGPASLNLKYQLIESADNAVVTGSSDNDFIKVSSSHSVGKAVNGGGGNDVIDGGVGSTFVTGGTNHNTTFFLDGRAPGTSWSTITDFKNGVDKATIWGFVKGVSSIDTSFANYNSEGAAGYTGLTLHFKNLLPDGQTSGANANLNSITFSGHTLAELGASSLADLNSQINSGTNAHILVGATQDSSGTHSYLYIH